MKYYLLRFTANESCNKQKCAIPSRYVPFHIVEIVKRPKKIVLFYYSSSVADQAIKPD